MQAPSAQAMLDTWEQGGARSVIERAALLLSLAAPQTPPEARARLPVGERDRVLLALREAVFGPVLTGLVACEACGEQLELEIGVGDLTALPSPPEALEVTADEYRLWLRLLDGSDLAAAAAFPRDAAAALLRQRCVVRAECGGAPVAADALPESVLEAAGAALAEADKLADLRFALGCVACGHAWRAPFDAAAFLWAELDAWAGRMLREVHVLASAYGWSEADILRLGPARRARYLHLAAG